MDIDLIQPVIRPMSIHEGLSNILKHMNADRAIILLPGSSPNIVLRVEDNGRGFDVKAQKVLSAATKQTGICSMQERVNLLQWRMTRPMQGTRTGIKIPCRQGNCHVPVRKEPLHVLLQGRHRR